MPRSLQQIKVFGERNTGTRAVIRMIDAAEGVRGAGHPGIGEAELAPYRAMVEDLAEMHQGPWKKVYREAARDALDDVMGPVGAWKHSAPVFGPDFERFGVKVLFLVRNPYSWILSLHKRPYHFLGHRKEDFTEFLNFPWLTMGRDRVDRILPSPVDLWNTKLAAYRAFMHQAAMEGVACKVLKFEDFVADPSANLGAVLTDLTGAPAALEDLETPTKEGGMKAQARKDYYAKEEWRSALSEETVSLINGRLDWELADHFGYRRLIPSEFPAAVSDGE